ncbi:hypothetical protein HG264_03735 [Pseudomonas sp. gcc21]|uniref:hypothetical protein n=1 Tax=Pseudomonas sp. gcc21 TaxID=2726989 RepID=UPI0014520960|nr:hypothetical protein [Pseudomonas sp. gcc21]QJD58082.1 hypothetical protein HG264_03735 [Pseudomonas sp. gcc21]
MTFLAVYHHENLLNPIKLLTHREDIAATLEAVSIRYDSIDIAAAFNGDEDDARILDNLESRFDDYPHRKIIRLPAIPRYATPPSDAGEPEQSCTEAGLRLFVKGRGVFCLHQANHLYALGCEAGDLVSVPAGVIHWFRQGAGPECLVVRLGHNAEGVRCVIRDERLAKGIELPEI